MAKEKTILGFQGKYKFLANFYEVPVYLNGDTTPYPSVENAFQASKTQDLELREKIRKYDTCKVQQFAEKELDQLDWLDGDVSDWWNSDSLVKTMKDLIFQKFDCRDIGLVQKLLATNPLPIIAPSYQDSLGLDLSRTMDSFNTLGKFLMETRNALLSEKAIINEFLLNNTPSKKIADHLGISEKMLCRKKQAYHLLHISPIGIQKQSADWDDVLLFIKQNPNKVTDGFPFSVPFPKMYSGQEYEIITAQAKKYIARVDDSREFMSEGLEWKTLGVDRDGNKERSHVAAWKIIEK